MISYTYQEAKKAKFHPDILDSYIQKLYGPKYKYDLIECTVNEFIDEDYTLPHNTENFNELYDDNFDIIIRTCIATPILNQNDNILVSSIDMFILSEEIGKLVAETSNLCMDYIYPGWTHFEDICT